MSQALKPPFDIDAEKSVLSSMLLDRDALIKAAELLNEEDFYDPINKSIFACCIELFDSSSAVDIVTLKSYLTKKKLLKKVGGIEYLSDLVSILPLTTNIEYYSKIIKEASLRRQIISMSSDLVSMGIDETRKIDEIMDEIEQRIFSVSVESKSKGFVHIKNVITEILERMENPEKNRESLRGLSSGFQNLDKYIGGLRKGDLIILAARPSVGKTAFMLEMVRSIATNLFKKIAVFSLEMGKDQIVDRLFSLETNIDLMKLRMGDLDAGEWARFNEDSAKLYDTDIYIDDTPGLHISELRSKARKIDLELGLDAIFVDYLQLLKGRNKDNRAQEVSEISQGLKNIARELRVPVIALSQLNRSVESRNDRRPQLSDLRESGSIEQDADIVIFLHREAMYNQELTPDERKKAEAIVSKNRNGATGIVKLIFAAESAKYSDDPEDAS